MTRPTTEMVQGVLAPFRQRPVGEVDRNRVAGPTGPFDGHLMPAGDPMLTALEIENFKGIAARQRIEDGAADVDGGVLELGSFARLVHKPETERAIVRWARYVHEDGAFDGVGGPVRLVGCKPRGGRRGQ